MTNKEKKNKYMPGMVSKLSWVGHLLKKRFNLWNLITDT